MRSTQKSAVADSDGQEGERGWKGRRRRGGRKRGKGVCKIMIPDPGEEKEEG